jgi:predicted DNA-binding transcriptional regulator YafY
MPPEFHLVEYWTAWSSRYESNRPQFPVQVRVSPQLLEMLRFLKDPIFPGKQNGPDQDESGWCPLTIHFDTFENARKRLLNFGGEVEILSPRSLRDSVLDFAQQTINVYQRKSIK